MTRWFVGEGVETKEISYGIVEYRFKGCDLARRLFHPRAYAAAHWNIAEWRIKGYRYQWELINDAGPEYRTDLLYLCGEDVVELALRGLYGPPGKTRLSDSEEQAFIESWRSTYSKETQ